MGRSKGFKNSEETKRKMSIAKKGCLGHAQSKEIRKKISKTLLGRKFSIETIKKMSISHIGKPNSRYGQRTSEETKQKMRESALKRMKEGNNKVKYKNTDIERIIEKLLKKENINFIKQYYITKVGIVDFFLNDFSIIVECDGEYWHNTEKARKKDINRDFRALMFHGFKTIRLNGGKIRKDYEYCFKIIKKELVLK